MGKELKKERKSNVFFLFFILLPLFSYGQGLQRCPAFPDTLKMKQKGSYVLQCFLKGDEHLSIFTTTDGYPLVENKNGEFEYAIIDNFGNINSSSIKAKNIGDRTIENRKYLERIDKKSILNLKKSSSNASFIDKNTANVANLLMNFPITGTRNLLVLLIDFTDRPFQLANINFNNLMNQPTYNGTGSFRDYWTATSYGNLTINSTINGWYHAANNMAFYGTNSNGNDTNPRLLVREAIDAAENAGTDFSIYDNDGDGKVDGIIVIHAGYGEEAGGGQNTIWSHHWTLGNQSRTYDGVIIDDYAIVPELRDNEMWGINISNIGVMCHEFGHSLGLPDLYDTNSSNGTSAGIGRWGLMGSGNWNNGGASPSHLCAWSKIFLGWSNPTLLSSPSSISLSNSVQNNNIYRINTSHSNEYFLLENRQSIGFDIGLPGAGLAIWHINTSKTTSTNISNNDVNADEDLKGVDLEEADGRNDLDVVVDNRGDNGDLFPGNTQNRTFRDNSNPNSQTYSPIVSINKPIANIIEASGNVRFDFMGYNPITGPSTVCTQATYTIANFPTGAAVQWNVSNNLQIISSTGNSVILQSIGVGAGWVEAVITIFGNNITLPRYNIQVSPAYALYAVSYPDNCDEIVLKADVPDNTVITWTASPNILIDGYQSPYTKQGNTVSVYSTNNQEGSIQGLTASGCMVNEFIFTPCLDWSFTSNCEWTSPAPGEPLIASCSPAYSDAMKYEWYIHTQYLTSTDEPDLHTIEWPCIEGDLNVRAITPSGATQLTSACSFFPLCYSYSYFTLSPNPASSGSVMVNLDETNLSKKQNTENTAIESQNKTYEIQLWNSFGLIKIVRTDMKKYQLDLNGIPAGFYYVLVVKDGKTYRKQLIIK